MKSTLFLCFFLFWLWIPVISQDDPIKWGEVPTEDLTMTVYDQDTSAGAVVLCDFGNIEFDLGLQGPAYKFFRHRRIKILNRAGFDRGDVAIYFFNSQRVDNLNVQVFQPDGSQVKLDKKDFFDEKVTDEVNALKFTVPDLQLGTVFEFKYNIYSENLLTLREWYFQEDIPVRWSELRITMLDWFKYVTLFQGREKLTVSENKKSLRTFSGLTAGKTDYSRYVAEHVPALKEEPYSTTIDDYRMHIRFQLKTIEIPNQLVRTFMTNWEELAEELLKMEGFGHQFSRKGNFKKIEKALAPYLSETSTGKEKIETIYSFVNNHLEWNGEYTWFATESLDKIFEKKTGTSGEINLILLALLKHHDIKAYPVLLSTRDHGKMYPFYPFLSQFDHLIVYIKDGENVTFLDGGNPLRPAGLLQVNALNYKGWLLDDWGNQKWIQVNSAPATDIMLATFKLTKEGALEGRISCQHKGYSAVNERSAYRDNPKGGYWESRLQKKYAGAEVQSVQFKNPDVVDKPLSDVIQCSIQDAALVTGDFMYVSPMIYSNFDENPFKINKRSYPVEIPFPLNEKAIININLPSGFKVEELPEPVRLALPNNGGQFQFMASTKDGKIQVVSQIQIAQLQFLPEEYDTLKNFFDLIAEKHQEQIVLKEKT